MNDAAPRTERLFIELARKTPAQRVAMGAQMFDAARALLEAALRKEGLTPGTLDWKLALLDRTYGSEISPRLRQRLIERWSVSPEPKPGRAR